MFFHPYADDLAGRLVVTPGMRVLEVACGTGLLTRRVLERLRGRGSILATDLNEAMLAYGRGQLPPEPGLEWRQPDAASLAVPARCFDAVLCPFGRMFFTGRAAGI